MSNILVTVEQDVLNELKYAIQTFENAVKPVEQAIEGGLKEIGSIAWNMLTTDAQTLYNDFPSLIKQIGVNIQNENPGIDLTGFILAFPKASLAVAIPEGLKLAELDWNILATALGWNLNIPIVKGNAGNVNQ